MTNATLESGPLESGSSPGGDGIGALGPVRRGRWRALTGPSSQIPTLLGVAIAAIGFALLGIAWVKVAALTEVWQQMPYVLSAGLPGLGLVMTGLVVVNVSARRQDAAARARQMAALAEALGELQRSLR